MSGLRSGSAGLGSRTTALAIPGSGGELARELKRRLAWLGVLANGIGASTVAVFLLIAPDSFSGDDLSRAIRLTAPAFVLYMLITLPLGRLIGERALGRIWDWLASERPAGDEERAAVLRAPLAFALSAARFWVVAALLFGTLIATISPLEGLNAAGTTLLGALTACTLQYLLAERTMRPVTARALAGGPPPASEAPGIATRLTMAWMLGTGVPLLGLFGLALAELLGADVSRGQQIGTIFFLISLAVGVGLTTLRLAARSVGEPVASVEQAMERVGQGDLDVLVAVNDGSEVGRLQAGFNRMAGGLAERERLRDLFGRQVGRDVAAAALDQEVSLGGEAREVAALFVDVIGSTALAAERPPEEVVGLLNEFFTVIIRATDQHGGLVNKFEGDAALCIFGAPVAIEDCAGSAMAAARQMRRELETAVPGLRAAIGVSAGTAVAGNVGSEERYEYTVIGDPVNEAARLCELAKGRPGRLLASQAVLEAAASSAEAANWSLGEEVVLRGRRRPTRLAVPS